MSEEGGDDPHKVRARMPFEKEQISLKPSRGAGIVLYALLAAACVGVALYMGLVVRHPLTSAYVLAPTVGAFWFIARLVMMLSPRR